MNPRTFFAVLLAVTAAVLWTAGAASATDLTSPEGELFTGELTAESEGHSVLHSPVVGIECTSSVSGAVASHGGEGVPAKVTLSALSFTGCTNEWTVDVVSAGTLSIEYTSGSSGHVYSTGATITATRFGISCSYATSNTTIGTLTGGSPATLKIEASIPRHAGSFLCGGSSASWTGSYIVTSPSTLLVDKAMPDRDGRFHSVTKAIVYGTEEGNHKLEWTVDGFGAGITCDESSWKYQFGLGVKTEQNLIFRPTVDKCHTTESGDNFEVILKNCEFYFYVAKPTDEKTEQTLQMICPIKPAEIKHPKCAISIPTHKWNTGVTYTEIVLGGKKALTVDIKVRLEGLELAGTGCGAAEKKGWLEGSLTVEAFEERPAPEPAARVDITVQPT